MTIPTRRSVADEFGIPLSTLREREEVGALPRFGTVSIEVYRRRLELILAARGSGLSMQRIRRAWPIGGGENGR